MRKELVWTDEQAIDDFLQSQEIGHLTTIDPDGWPRAVPLNYLWQGGAIYFHTGLGGKIEDLRQNPKVSFTVTEALGLLTSEISASPCRDTQLGQSVLIRGLAKEIRNPEQKQRVLNKFIAKYDPAAVVDPESEQMAPESIMDQPGFHQCLVVEIEVASLIGRRHLLDGKPEKYRQAVADYFQKKAQDFGSERDFKTARLLSRTSE